MRRLFAAAGLALSLALCAAPSPAPAEEATPTPAPAPEAPAPGEYSPGGACSGSSGVHKVEPKAKDILGAATCRSAVERALKPLVCASQTRPVDFQFAYKATTGTGRIYCR